MLQNKRLAIIRLSAVGDVLHCTPVARAIKKSAPSCHITWVVGQVSADVLAGNPYIDEIYIWSRERWETMMRQQRFTEAVRYWRQLKQDLHARRFDIALDIHGIFISGLVTIATGAPRRIGLSGTRELNSLFTNETAMRLPAEIHVIERYLSILRPLGIPHDGYDMTLAVSAAGRHFADNFLRRMNYNPNKKLIAISPRTTWPTKNWPSGHFAAAAARLHPHAQLLLCGGPGDRETAEEIVRSAGVPIMNAVGQTSLQELAALLSCSDVLLTGDTGPLHMAIALGTPTVSIFGPTDPAVYGPLTSDHIVLQNRLECGPCHKQRCRLNDMRCQYTISPEIAANAVIKLLEKKRAGLVF